MAKEKTQAEKNLSTSFGYVKKDMLMLNDAFSDLHDKVQHLSLNHAMLLEEIEKIKIQITKCPSIKAAKQKTTKKKTIKKVVKKKK